MSEDDHALLTLGDIEIQGRIMPASNATFFGTATLVTRAPVRACRKKVRWPGGPTVPATKRSGGSKLWITDAMAPT